MTRTMKENLDVGTTIRGVNSVSVENLYDFEILCPAIYNGVRAHPLCVRAWCHFLHGYNTGMPELIRTHGWIHKHRMPHMYPRTYIQIPIFMVRVRLTIILSLNLPQPLL